MIRLLLAGTALTAVLATAAFAQSSSATPDESVMSSATSSALSSMASSSDMSGMSAMSSMPASDMSASSAMPMPSGFTILSGYTQASTDQMATKIIGAHVYDSTADNANDLGKINDFIVNTDGSIAAVIVGVGGFLGIGEKQVAVDFHALQWATASDNSQRFVLQTTKDELTNAPDFKTVDTNVSAMPSGSSAMPASDMMGASSSAQ